MTNELEKQFFDTFGIEPKHIFRGCKLGAKYYAEICDETTCNGCDEEIRKTEYPTITDHMLLELICIVLNTFETFEQLEAYKMEAEEGKEINAELKAENEELTIINARLLGRLEVDEKDTSLVFNLDKELRQKEKEFYTAIQKVVKFKETLTEIKEICKNNDELKGDFNLVDCDKYKLGKHNLANRILQKISECEGNDEN